MGAKHLTETDYNLFEPLMEVLQRAQRIPKNRTITKITAQPQTLNALADELLKQGFHRVSSDIKAGSQAILLEANNHQLIRIEDRDISHHFERDCPQLLQPLATIECGGHFLIEVLPKVHTLKEVLESKNLSEYYNMDSSKTVALMEQLMTDILHERKFLFDPTLQNVGLIKARSGETVPVIIDRGAVIDLAAKNEMNDHVQTYFDIFTRRASQNSAVRERYHVPQFGQGSTHMSEYKDNMEGYLIDLTMKPVSELPYRKAQEDYIKDMGLLPSKINGVITPDDLQTFLDRRKHMAGAPVKTRDAAGNETTKPFDPNNTVFAVMAQRRQYHTEVAAQLPNHPDGGFCERLRKASDSLAPDDNSGRKF